MARELETSGRAIKAKSVLLCLHPEWKNAVAQEQLRRYDPQLPKALFSVSRQSGRHEAMACTTWAELEGLVGHCRSSESAPNRQMPSKQHHHQQHHQHRRDTTFATFTPIHAIAQMPSSRHFTCATSPSC